MGYNTLYPLYNTSLSVVYILELLLIDVQVLLRDIYYVMHVAEVLYKCIQKYNTLYPYELTLIYTSLGQNPPFSLINRPQKADP